MAASTVTATITNTDDTQKRVRVHGTLAISASPGTYTTGGLALSFSGVGIPSVSNPDSNLIAASVIVQSAAASGYIYQFNTSTAKLQILQVPAANGSIATAPGPMVELPAAATPAGVSGDTITFYAEFKRI